MLSLWLWSKSLLRFWLRSKSLLRFPEDWSLAGLFNEDWRRSCLNRRLACLLSEHRRLRDRCWLPLKRLRCSNDSKGLVASEARTNNTALRIDRRCGLSWQWVVAHNAQNSFGGTIPRAAVGSRARDATILSFPDIAHAGWVRCPSSILRTN